MIQPYLHFNGNCEEAFNFYAECFNGKIVHISRLNNNLNNHIMHAQVQLTESGGSVSGADAGFSDNISGMEILVFLPSRERVEEVAAKLSVGGKLVSGYKPHPPPDDNSGGAEVLDKYGYTWFLCA